MESTAALYGCENIQHTGREAALIFFCVAGRNRMLLVGAQVLKTNESAYLANVAESSNGAPAAWEMRSICQCTFSCLECEAFMLVEYSLNPPPHSARVFKASHSVL